MPFLKFLKPKVFKKNYHLIDFNPRLTQAHSLVVFYGIYTQRSRTDRKVIITTSFHRYEKTTDFADFEGIIFNYRWYYLCITA